MDAASKIISLDRLPVWREELRSAGHKLVTTNGCFDILHAGHVVYLEAARKLGDRLLVGINSDASVRALKGEGRPVIGVRDRALILAALESVGAVCVFDEPTATRFLRAAQPDIYAKGGDYTLETLNQEERRSVEELGGRIEIIPKVPGRSTSELLSRLSSGEF